MEMVRGEDRVSACGDGRPARGPTALGVFIVTHLRVDGNADPAGLRVNAEGGLEQMVPLLGDLNIELGVRVCKNDLVLALRELPPLHRVLGAAHATVHLLAELQPPMEGPKVR